MKCIYILDGLHIHNSTIDDAKFVNNSSKVHIYFKSDIFKIKKYNLYEC
jgi:hypothetical protein